MISLKSEGRRTYIVGNTYPIRDQIRAIGAHWDADRRAWWTAKRAEAEALVQQLSAGSASAEQTHDKQAPGEDAIVAGRAEYKGRAYYVAGRTVRGRTHWDDRVTAVTSRDGSKMLLYSRDGSMQFWAHGARILKTYDRPQTIRGLQKFAEEARQGFPGRQTCYMCGSPSCDGARGGLCEHD